MTELIAKIRAALDEDERAATEALLLAVDNRGEWTYAERRVTGGPGLLIVGHIPANRGRHIARHDPARVLRQVAAMRKILDIHGLETDPCGGAGLSSEWPCSTVLALAEAYGIEP
jgi:hypothetical protein